MLERRSPVRELLAGRLSLPDMSGWNLARELRANSRLSHMKIMIVSANAHEYSSDAREEHDAFIIKPVQKITALARDVSAGKTDVPEYHVKGRDEIASLGRSFNLMHRSLQNAIKMLEGA